MLHRVIAALARRTVREEGTWCDRQLVFSELQESFAGSRLFDDRLDELLRDTLMSRSWPLEDHAGRVIDAAIAERFVLTHRLSQDEIASGALDVTADLAAIDRLAACDGGLHTEDGVPLRHRERRVAGAGRDGVARRTATLSGPAGWLGRFAPDSLVAARAAGGFLRLETVAAQGVSPAPDDVVDGLARLVDLANEGDGNPVGAGLVQLAAMVDHPEWFAEPRPPFTDLLDLAGFEVDGDLVGRPGSWEAYKKLTDTIDALTRDDLPEHDTSILLDGLKAFNAWQSDGRRPAAGLSQRLGRHWAAAFALADELRRRATSPDQLAVFAAVLEPPIREWLGSKAATLRGHTADAERLAREALKADAGFGPALRDLAWIESDRGNAREAVNLLHRVVPHDDEHLVSLRRYGSAGSPSAGRNDPCPCGSGRKFKVCHLGRSLLPDAERLRWLLDKIWQFTMTLASPHLVDEIVRADLMAGALRLDLLVFEEGWLQRFAQDRGVLLPETERAWIERWSEEHVASVFRVEEVLGDGRGALVDAVSGRRLVVEPWTSLSGFTAGRLLWARLLPIGDAWWTSGVVRPVWLAERAELLAVMAEGTSIEQRYDALVPDDVGLTLTNTSGDPHVFCTTTVVVGDLEVLVKALDDRLGRDGEALEWSTKEDTPSMAEAVTATFVLDEDQLRIETNSLRRRAAALELVVDLVGPVEIMGDERVPSARARALHQDEELADEFVDRLLGEIGADDDDDDEYDDEDEFDGDEFDDESLPELEELLAAHKAAHDERWLDMEIPALGGMTPRQAATDEVARADLVTLLAEMDDRSLGAGSGELRRRLGLT